MTSVDTRDTHFPRRARLWAFRTPPVGLLAALTLVACTRTAEPTIPTVAPAPNLQPAPTLAPPLLATPAGLVTPSEIAATAVPTRPPAPQLAYVVNQLSNDVTIVDGAAGRPLGSIKVGANPHELARTPDGRTLYVSNFQGNTLSVIEV